MSMIQEWLLRMVAISMVCGVADSIMPKGSIKQVGKLVCGLVMLWVLLSPIAEQGLDAGTDWLLHYQTQLDQTAQDLEQQMEEKRKVLIEENCAAYIVDKAAELGMSCTARVMCQMGEEGLYLPQKAEITGNCSDVVQSRLTQILEEDLGIPADQQSYFLEEAGT